MAWLVHPITVGDVLLGLLGVLVVGIVWKVVREARRRWDESRVTPTEAPDPPEVGVRSAMPPRITHGTLDDWRKALRR